MIETLNEERIEFANKMREHDLYMRATLRLVYLDLMLTYGIMVVANAD